MKTTNGNVATGQIVMATVLLIGVVMLTYGFAKHDRVFLYAGLAVTGGGVLNGILRIIGRSNR